MVADLSVLSNPPYKFHHQVTMIHHFRHKIKMFRKAAMLL